MNGHNYAFVHPPESCCSRRRARCERDGSVSLRRLRPGRPLPGRERNLYSHVSHAAADTEKLWQTVWAFSGIFPLPAPHVCMAVEISAPGDPCFPELDGRARAGPQPTGPSLRTTTRRKKWIYPRGESAGLIAAYARPQRRCFSRTVTVRYGVAPEVLRKLEGRRSDSSAATAERCALRNP